MAGNRTVLNVPVPSGSPKILKRRGGVVRTPPFDFVATKYSLAAINDFLVLHPINPTTLATYCEAFSTSRAKDDAQVQRVPRA